MAVMPKQFPKEQRDRAIRMVVDHLDEYESPYMACKAISPRVGIGVESLRRWVAQALVDSDVQPGVKTAEKARIRELEREVRDLREANEILKAATVFFARELDPRHR
jgi:transposase